MMMSIRQQLENNVLFNTFISFTILYTDMFIHSIFLNRHSLIIAALIYMFAQKEMTL